MSDQLAPYIWVILAALALPLVIVVLHRFMNPLLDWRDRIFNRLLPRPDPAKSSSASSVPSYGNDALPRPEAPPHHRSDDHAKLGREPSQPDDDPPPSFGKRRR